ncbi:MAG: GGDEF domain-containing protein [Peptostreptococcaceae bacterium]
MINYKRYNTKHIRTTSIIAIVFILIMSIIVYKKLNNNKEFNESYNILCAKLDEGLNIVDEYDEVKKTLIEKKKYTELYTLEAIKAYKKNIEKSKENLHLALEHHNKNTNYIADFYIYKYFFKIHKYEGDYEKAKLNLIEAIKSIPKNKYNESYKEIGILNEDVHGLKEFESLFIDIIEKIILQEKYINPKVELYLREKLRTIYITNSKYAKATNSLITSIDISKKINDNYSLANAMISLGIVYEGIGGEKNGANIIKEGLNIEIEDKYKDAYIKTFGYLNLAYIQIFDFKSPKETINTLENIEQYRTFFSEENFRDIEIYKLIYEANAYILEKNLNLAKQNLDKIEKLLKKEKYEFYVYKELEYKLTYARYLYEKEDYENAFLLYEEGINECKNSNEKSKLRVILREIIPLYEETGFNKNKYSQYVEELMDLNEEIESLRYLDYSIYISDSINQRKVIKENYDKYIKSARTGYLFIIGVLIFYIHTNRKIKKLKYVGEYDGLTNVYNRKKFDIDYKKLLNKCDKFTCIIMDIDNFKNINDTHGHAFGDIVLKNSSKKIKNILPDNFKLYRYGGEEFVIMGKYNNEKDVIEVAENIRKAIEEMIWKENITVTMSIGIAFSTEDRNNVLENSDKNLYKAKNTGKNKVIY